MTKEPCRQPVGNLHILYQALPHPRITQWPMMGPPSTDLSIMEQDVRRFNRWADDLFVAAGELRYVRELRDRLIRIVNVSTLLNTTTSLGCVCRRHL